jgi:uncharacterized protein (DUF58 family)
MHRSPFFGQSLEFAQHREYVPGDDVRYLDWKVWSKTDKFYIKQYEAETNLRAAFVVDASESMVYGRDKHVGRGTFDKYEWACTGAACLAYAAVRQQDAAGLTSFGWDVKQTLPPKASQRQISAMGTAFDHSRPTQADKTEVRAALKKVAENARGRSLVVLFSDLLTDRDGILKGVELLRHRHHDVMVFHVLDDDELDFPYSGMTKFEGMEELPDLFCDPKALRDGYLEALNEYLAEVKRGLNRLGVDYTLVRTGDPLDTVLTRVLFRRMADHGNLVRR